MNDHRKILDDIECSPERELERELLALRHSFRIFSTNFHELKQYLVTFNDYGFAIELMKNNNRDKLEASWQEVRRLLHNYLSSAKSLIEHSRKQTKTLYKDKDFLKEYDNRVKSTFHNSNLQHFIKDLRNYTHHCSLPVLGASIERKVNENVVSSYNLKIETLLKWSSWNQKAKEYIKSFDTKMPIDEFVSDYYSLVGKFYTWFFSRQEEIHSVELNSLKMKKKQIGIKKA